MKLELIEKFLLALAPPAAQAPIHSMFSGMQTAPVQVVVHGLGFLSDAIKKEGTPEGAAAINGLLLGIALVHGSQTSPDLIRVMENYLDLRIKEKGENVINFFQVKASKT